VAGGEELRAAMRRFPAGVAVLTVAVDGQRFGITVASLVSLALEPPLVSVSIGLQSSIYEPLRQAGRFAVSVLGEEQVGIAQHFARSGLPPLVAWEGIPLHQSSLPEPLIARSLAWLECTAIARHEAGDHTIFVGSVDSIELGSGGRGLAYVRGGYVPA
jgi:3-hydroxy-9,10-secoandrosta-1,3,5(10)-triene-9,17-dione monooxygenase reductase component